MIKIYFLACFFLLNFGLKADDLRRGNKAFQNKDFDKAFNAYNDALIKSPQNPYVFFNQGSISYRNKKYMQAITLYQKALASENYEVRAYVYFNIGNSFFRLGDLEKSLENYKKSLEIYPENEDCKFNYEFVLNLIKEEQKNEKKNQPPPESNGGAKVSNKIKKPNSINPKHKKEKAGLSEKDKNKENLFGQDETKKDDDSGAEFELKNKNTEKASSKFQKKLDKPEQNKVEEGKKNIEISNIEENGLTQEEADNILKNLDIKEPVNKRQKILQRLLDAQEDLKDKNHSNW